MSPHANLRAYANLGLRMTNFYMPWPSEITHSHNLLETYYEPGIIPDEGGTVANKGDNASALLEAILLMGDSTKQVNT